jgi:pyruvate,water dikinase
MFITWFKEIHKQDVAWVGGKGANLGELYNMGLPVPPGFVVTTAGYRRFVQANHLQDRIISTASRVKTDDPVVFAMISTQIREDFLAGLMPDDLADDIRAAYEALFNQLQSDKEMAVAVRSSATAEDLPTASFAGQQETYLNVRGIEALQGAVKQCWASLWTARALSYRTRQRIDPAAVSLAVVVQPLVAADVSGILFTANPANGRRDQVLIEAVWGLGEAIVGGQVTPDQWIVEKKSGHVLSRRIGEKTMMTAPIEQGTAETPVPVEKRGQSAINDEVAAALVRYGIQIEEHYHSPMDVEWAVARGEITILQARPITALPDLLSAHPSADMRVDDGQAPHPQPVVWESPLPGAKWVRRQVVEHMPEPLSPLFAELYLPALEQSVGHMQAAMGVPRLLRENLIEPPMFATVNGYAYMRMDLNLRWWTLPVIFPAMAMGVTRLLRNAGIRYWRDDVLPAYLATVAAWRAVDPAAKRDEELLAGIQTLAQADAKYWFGTALAVGTAKVTDGLLDTFLQVAAPGRNLTSGHFSRGFHSKTLEAQIELEAIAARVRSVDSLRQQMLDIPADQLWERLAQAPEGAPIRTDLEAYMDRYGHQIQTLDFAEATLAEAPLPVLVGLKNLVKDPGVDIRSRQATLARERETLIRQMAASLDPVRGWLFLHLVALAQRFGPYREESLFYQGLGWPKLRELALTLGRRLVDIGSLDTAGDLFYLRTDEIRTAIVARTGGQGLPELGALAQRRRKQQRAQAQLHPPPAVPPAYGLKLGPIDLSSRESQKRNQGGDSTLRGFAVSPGFVQGRAVVIRSAADFHHMTPGAILVCPTTTPAWTPLLGQAAGLVTDIGGVLAHGSIVAREYGIPAVLGTGIATAWIQTGETITVNGDTGTVTKVDTS